MKMFVYGLREYDERQYFDKFSKQYDVEIASCGEKPTLENAWMAEGFEAINILTAPSVLGGVVECRGRGGEDDSTLLPVHGGISSAG